MLQAAVDQLTYSVLKLDPAARSAQALNFFIYDSIKILLLLFAMISVIGFLRSYLAQEKIKAWVTGTRAWGNFLAALFGAVTPFCSCSSIPLFISFLSAGVPLGITFSFLVTSPLINEYLVVLMLGFFGWKITLAYVASGLAIGTIAGIILGKMNLDSYIEKDIVSAQMPQSCRINPRGLKQRILFGLNEAKCVVDKIWLWILFGVGLGAVIHNYVPTEMVHSVAGAAGVFSVPVAVLVGVPIYANCAAIIPIAVALFAKGFPLGTALAFMMAAAALSLPEAVMLRRAMKPRLIVIFFAITSIGIIFTGYLFNMLQRILS